MTSNHSTDKALIKELWEPILKTWFTEGQDNPRITVKANSSQRILLGQPKRH